MDLMTQVVIAAGIPTAGTGFFVWMLKRWITKRDKERQREEEERERRTEQREQNREKLDLFLLKSNSANIALAEATAKAVQRIPDAHCNGDMHDALAYATAVKHEQKDFLTSLGIHALHEE